jgi:hypothetical protein
MRPSPLMATLIMRALLSASQCSSYPGREEGCGAVTLSHEAPAFLCPSGHCSQSLQRTANGSARKRACKPGSALETSESLPDWRREGGQRG